MLFLAGKEMMEATLSCEKVLLLEGQPVRERRCSIRWESIKKINWPSQSFPTCFRGSPHFLETEQAIPDGGGAACWVRPGSDGISHGWEHVGGEVMNPQTWAVRLEICLLNFEGCGKQGRNPRRVISVLREGTSEAGSAIVAYWVVCMTGMFNGIDRLHFCSKRQPMSLQQVLVERSWGSGGWFLSVCWVVWSSPWATESPGLLTEICASS